MHATYIDAHGKKSIVIPKNGNAPLLFLEFLQKTDKKSIVAISDIELKHEFFLKIQMYWQKETYLECLEYINANI